jgi:hypothetical protein
LDTASLALTMTSMQAGSRAQQVSLIALKQANEMDQSIVNLLSSAAEDIKALLPEGVGGMIDRDA